MIGKPSNSTDTHGLHCQLAPEAETASVDSLNRNSNEILKSEGADDYLYSEDDEDIIATEGATEVAAIIDRCADEDLNNIVSQNILPKKRKSRSKMIYDVTKPTIKRHKNQRINTIGWQ